MVGARHGQDAAEFGIRQSALGEELGDPTEGLAVYHNAYRAQLVGCLRDTFEKTWAWLGDDAFDRAARAHVAAHPPSSWTLGDYGADFADTLKSLYPNDPEVAELAWLDWTLRRAFDGPDGDPIGVEALAQVNWDAAVLRFIPTLVVGQVLTNVAALWSAIGAGQTPTPAQHLPEPHAIRVWRLGLSPQYRSIDRVEHRALELAAEGRRFGEVCALLGDGLGESQASQVIGAVMGSWIQDGLIQSVG